MKLQFLEQDNDDIACISCTHRYNKGCSCYCDIDDHLMHYAEMWTETCEQHKLIDITVQEHEDTNCI